MSDRRIAIMQPYIYPYIGYFHLIKASDFFIFCDDVNYINKGWINRNRILNKDTDVIFSVPVSRGSSFKLIKDTNIAADDKWKNKFYKKLIHNYRKAPYFFDVIDLIMSAFYAKHSNIGDLAVSSICNICSYLNMEFSYAISSTCCPETRGMKKEDRLIEMVKKNGYNHYVNLPGGKAIYNKEYFLSKNIVLSFIKSNDITYRQFSDKFIPFLSIIDVVMFNSKEQVNCFMSNYSLE